MSMGESYVVRSVVGDIEFTLNETGDVLFGGVDDPDRGSVGGDLGYDNDVELYIYDNDEVYTMDVVMQGIFVGSVDRGTLDELFEKIRAWDIDPEYNF